MQSLAIICISNNFLYSQDSFEYIISNPSHQHINDCIEDQYGNVYIVGDNVYVENSQITSICGTIYKIAPDGEILLEEEYCYPDSTLSFHEVDIIHDSIYVFGSSGAVAIGLNELFEVYILNDELEVMNHSKRGLFADIYLGSMKHMILPAGDIVLLGVAIIADDLLETDIFFYQFTQNLDSVLCVRDERENDQMGLDFVQDPDNGGYKVFGWGNYPNTLPSYDALIHFDSVFNFILVDSIAWKLIGHHTSRNLSDTTYLLTGRKIYTNPINVDMGIVMLNVQDELLKNFSIGKEADTVDYAGVKDNIDFVTKDNIFFGGTSNFIVNQWPWQTDDSWINLINLDSNLNINWQRYYGGNAFYTLYGLLATKDGGCFMYAIRYDEITQFQEYDIYILKVDSNGLLTSVRDIPNIAANELFIYPNPASSQITVQFPGVSHSSEKELLIYNHLGVKVYQAEIPDRQDEMVIHTESLPVGFYFASIFSKGNQLAAGKIIIAR